MVQDALEEVVSFMVFRFAGIRILLGGGEKLGKFNNRVYGFQGL